MKLDKPMTQFEMDQMADKLKNQPASVIWYVAASLLQILRRRATIAEQET